MERTLYTNMLWSIGTLATLVLISMLHGNSNDFSRRYGANGYITNMPLYYKEAADHEHITPPKISQPSPKKMEKERIAQEKKDEAHQRREDAKAMTPEERKAMRDEKRKEKTPCCCGKKRPALMSQVPESSKSCELHTEYPRSAHLKKKKSSRS